MLVPRNISAIETHADCDNSRYALGGIRLERDGDGRAHAVATDGRRMIHVQWAEDDGAEYPAVGASAEHVKGFSAIIPCGAIDAASKAAKIGKRCIKPILKNVLVEESAIDKPEVKVSATNLEQTANNSVRQIDGRFPQWRDVFRKAHGTETVFVSLDPRFLAEACKALGTLTGGDDRQSVTLAIKDHESAVTLYARNSEGVNARAVVMPLAADNDSSAQVSTETTLGKFGVTVDPDYFAKRAELAALALAIEKAIGASGETGVIHQADAHDLLDDMIRAGRERIAERAETARREAEALAESKRKAAERKAKREAEKAAELAETPAETPAAETVGA